MLGRRKKRARQLDPEGGFLCMINCWRPDPEAADPEFPGLKLSMTTYMPVAADEPCLCGSGKTFGACCRRKPLWYPICPDPSYPEETTYSQVRLQSATFTDVKGAVIRERLMDDLRLCCTEDTDRRAFWIYWGEPAIQMREGILCFGDIELKDNRTLLITAMSDVRMRVLLDFVREVCGDVLGSPEMEYDPVTAIDKRTGESVVR